MYASDYIAVFAASISLLSLVMSLLGYLISRRALRISEHDFDEKNLSVNAYLIDSFRFKRIDKIFCTFAISFTNNSSAPRSFTNLELEVEFVDEEGVYGKAISIPDNKEFPLGISQGYKKLETPINLAPKETVSGWVTFLLPTSSHRKFRISSYKVSGKMSDGHVTSVESYLMRQVDYEKET